MTKFRTSRRMVVGLAVAVMVADVCFAQTPTDEGVVAQAASLTCTSAPGGLDRALSAPELKHVNIDISWDEVAKYVVDTPESTKATADLINRHPDRFIFGSDVVAPADAQAQIKVFDTYAPLWKLLSPEASQKVRVGNYERLFDEGRRRVRAWEAANVKSTRQ